jgi:hypothetical protein
MTGDSIEGSLCICPMLTGDQAKITGQIVLIRRLSLFRGFRGFYSVHSDSMSPGGDGRMLIRSLRVHDVHAQRTTGYKPDHSREMRLTLHLAQNLSIVRDVMNTKRLA